ncbi:MAG: hypothetical protein RLY35_1936 [Bacteroidota bacterium]|jgi:hypothetical protein
MKQLLMFLGLLIMATLSFSQSSGWVKSKEDNKGISGAYVLFESGRSCYTNEQGGFDITGVILGERLTIVAAGYQTAYDRYNAKDQIYLLSSALNVQLPLVISAGPSVVFKSETWNVGDFMWDQAGQLQLLIYEKEKRWKRQEDAHRTIFENVKLAFLSPGQSEWESLYLNENAIGFYHQFPGEVIVEGERNYYLKVEDQLALLPDSLFRPHFKPVVEKLDDASFLVTDYQPDYPAFSYYLAKRDSQWIPLHFIQDEKEMELFRSEYKYLGPREKLEAFQFELDHKIDKEIVGAYMSGFPNKSYHSPIYAPLILLGDTIMVFDHLHDLLTLYNQQGKKMNEMPCHHHKQKGMGKWKGQVWRDPTTHRLYTAYEKAGKVMWMEMLWQNDGLKPCMALAYPYCEKIKVKNDEVFFVYRPFESSQKRYLYKQKITHE